MIPILNKEILTEKDILNLIEFKIEESINLDFKSAGSLENSKSKKIEIAKDVSSFANSAGGFIVYGINEEDHVADSLSFIDGNIITKEWLEQIIQTRIQRKIDGLKIYPIRFEDKIEQTVYVIKIPESEFSPHMTSDKRFYKRYNFESVQMEEYEIRNLYNRTKRTHLQIQNITSHKRPEFDDWGQREEIIFFNLGFQVENIGENIEQHYKLILELDFKEYTIKWNSLDKEKPNHSLGNNNKRIISFTNTVPIFPNEILTMANFDFGLPSLRLKELLEREMSLKLLYTGGQDSEVYKLKEFLKTSI